MLKTGSKIGSYTVVEKIGAGGMGEVYRATDTKLGRDVALKVLPEALAGDPNRMGRFQREAQVLASLNHPHIATIHGLEESGVTRALVMELVDGSTLAERIAQGPLPREEALPIARQIAEALEYAHDRGVIHRDLKPANVKLTTDGKVKILDFGLAKALEGTPAAGDIATSPTLSIAATTAGLILGTAGYMSPEQARGKSADRRADIWSFGAVLFEMLTGKQTFSGETVTDTLAAVVRAEPEWETVPAATPRRIRELLRRCLEKDPRQRLQAIGEARIIIEQVLAHPEADAAAESAAPAATAQLSWIRAAAWGLAGGLMVAAVAFGVYLTRQPDAAVLHAAIPPPPDTTFALVGTQPGPVTVSPDGRMLAFASSQKGKVLLYLRHLNTGEAQPLAGTDGAAYPFWSPDSRWIGFFAGGGKLKKIEVTGGPPATICDATNGKGGTWNRDGVILFAPAHNTPIHRVSAAGGVSQPITQFNKERRDNSHRHPMFLPGGKRYLYLARSGGAEHTIVAGALDGGPEKELMKTSFAVEFASGHLLFIRDKSLMAQPFDPDSLEFTGDPAPVAEGVMQLSSGAARGVFSVSQSGVLAYQVSSEQGAVALEWFDRKGTRTGQLGDKADYHELRISPDGGKVAVSIGDAQTGMRDIWVYEVKRNLRTRFTYDPTHDESPVWSPDSRSIAFASSRKGTGDIYVKSLGGLASEELIYESKDTALPTSWSRDGKYIAFNTFGPSHPGFISVLLLEGDRKPAPFFQSEFLHVDGQFSPDGKWMAYMSLESGRPEIHVAPFPNPTRKLQVSQNGGRFPHWRRDGKQIVYQNQEGQMISVNVSTRGDTLEIGAAEPLGTLPIVGTTSMVAASPDSTRFLAISSGVDQPSAPMLLVVNWPAKLKKK